MSWRLLLSRRGLIRRGLLGLVWLAASRAGAQTPDSRDRGLGGTGVAPTDPAGEDRGIGGTGVIGTIRRFGSIVVNDLRIAYPPDVRVTIDGAPAAAGDLRLGQVVETIAISHKGRLMTRHIAVDHEVVGPIEALGGRALRVMGQHVALAEGSASLPWRRGEIVAVSGLRRPDGVIMASLVERRPAGPLRVTGDVVADRDGGLRIGGLGLSAIGRIPLGKRVTLAGRLVDGRLEVASVANPALALLSQSPSHLSIEGYVVRSAGGLTLTTGFDIAGAVPARAIPSGRSVRVVVSAHLDRVGGLRLDAVRTATTPRARDGLGDGHPGHGADGHHGASGGSGQAPAGRGGPSDGAPGGPGSDGDGPGGRDSRGDGPGPGGPSRGSHRH